MTTPAERFIVSTNDEHFFKAASVYFSDDANEAQILDEETARAVAAWLRSIGYSSAAITKL